MLCFGVYYLCAVSLQDENDVSERADAPTACPLKGKHPLATANNDGGVEALHDPVLVNPILKNIQAIQAV